jgi:hypothetical protein
MPESIENLRDTIVPKSDQLNAEQLLGSDLTITVTAVKRGSTDEQPISIHYQDDNGRPYKPCKTMRKVLIFAWGDNGNDWIGRSMSLYNDPDVKFGGVKVGGIRIRQLSHIKSAFVISLTATKGRKEGVKILPLNRTPEASAPMTPPAWLPEHTEAIAKAKDMTELKTAYEAATAAAKLNADAQARTAIIKAKDARKAAIEAAASVQVVDHETGEVI